MAPDPDRPPTILGPFGEGYCRVCRFVVGLDERGLLDPHRRGSSNVTADTGVCKGSGKTPPKRTPYRSWKSAFKVGPRKVECPLCAQQVIVLADGRIQGHNMPGRSLTACKAGWHTVPMAASMRPRDHSGERG